MKPYVITLKALVEELIVVSVNAPNRVVAENRADQIVHKMRVKEENIQLGQSEAVRRDISKKRLDRYEIIAIDEVQELSRKKELKS